MQYACNIQTIYKHYQYIRCALYKHNIKYISSILYRPSLHVSHIIRTYRLYIARVLYRYCIYVVYMLYISFTFCIYCLNIVYMSSRYCLDIIQILSRYYLDIVQILSGHDIINILSKYNYYLRKPYTRYRRSLNNLYGMMFAHTQLSCCVAYTVDLYVACISEMSNIFYDSCLPTNSF